MIPPVWHLGRFSAEVLKVGEAMVVIHRYLSYHSKISSGETSYINRYSPYPVCPTVGAGGRHQVLLLGNAVLTIFGYGDLNMVGYLGPTSALNKWILARPNSGMLTRRGFSLVQISPIIP